MCAAPAAAPVAPLPGVLRTLAGHREGAFLDLDVEIVFAEARDRHGDAVLIFAEAFNVVGRVGRRGFAIGHAVQHVEQAVETNG